MNVNDRKRSSDSPSPEKVAKKRSFPTKNVVFLVILVALQITAIILAALYNPKPKDTIKAYNVTAVTHTDGTMDISYDITWQALDENEPLTWVEIGMPHRYYTVNHSSLSDTIEYTSYTVDGDYTALYIQFKDAYQGGETVRFSFSVSIREMLCKDSDGYFIELVPSWFNAIPVENYCFKWGKEGATPVHAPTRTEENYYVYEGSLEPGDYKLMRMNYSSGYIDGGAHTVKHDGFYDDGASNELKENKAVAWVFAGLFIFIVFIAELYIIDSFVSYKRGRGFMMEHGHHVHVYGHVNPHYVRAARAHRSSSGGFRGGGGGCACACACACAGGGRAGCSQKDGYDPSFISRKDKKE